MDYADSDDLVWYVANAAQSAANEYNFSHMQDDGLAVFTGSEPIHGEQFAVPSEMEFAAKQQEAENFRQMMARRAEREALRRQAREQFIAVCIANGMVR